MKALTALLSLESPEYWAEIRKESLKVVPESADYVTVGSIGSDLINQYNQN